MRRIIPIIIVLFLTVPSIVVAHSGGTDSSGGHHDYNNVSGLGNYHYHHGYGPHLHNNGICPYDDSGTSSVTYTSYDDEEYTFTEDELFDYVYEEVVSNPDAYNVIAIEQYDELHADYVYLKKNTINATKARNNVKLAIIIVGIIGGIACYYTYCKYSGEYDRGYQKGFEDARKL